MDDVDDEQTLLFSLEREAAAHFRSYSDESRGKVDPLLRGFDETVEDLYQALETRGLYNNLLRVHVTFIFGFVVRFTRLAMGVETMPGANDWDQLLLFGVLGPTGLIGLACLCWVRHQKLKCRGLIRALASFTGACSSVFTIYLGNIVMGSTILRTPHLTEYPAECVFITGAFVLHLPIALSHLGLSLLAVWGSMCVLLCSLLTCPQLSLDVRGMLCSLLIFEVYQGYCMQWQRRTDFLAKLASGCYGQCQKGDAPSVNSNLSLKDAASNWLCQIYQNAASSEQSSNTIEDQVEVGLLPQEPKTNLDGLSQQPLDMMQDPHALSVLECEAAAEFFACSAESRHRVGLLLRGFDNKIEDLYQALETSSRYTSLVCVSCAFVVAAIIGIARLGEEAMLWASASAGHRVLCFWVSGGAGMVELACLGWARHQQLKCRSLIRALASFAGIVAAGCMLVMGSSVLDQSEQAAEYVFLMSAFIFHLPSLLSHLGLSLLEALGAMCLLLYPVLVSPHVTMEVCAVICTLLISHMLGGYYVQWERRRDFLAKLERNVFYRQCQLENQEGLSANSCFHGTGTGNGLASECQLPMEDFVFDFGNVFAQNTWATSSDANMQLRKKARTDPSGCLVEGTDPSGCLVEGAVSGQPQVSDNQATGSTVQNHVQNSTSQKHIAIPTSSHISFFVQPAMHFAFGLGAGLDAVPRAIAVLEQNTARIMVHNSTFKHFCKVIGDGDEAHGLGQMQHHAATFLVRMQRQHLVHLQQSHAAAYSPYLMAFDDTLTHRCRSIQIQGVTAAVDNNILWCIDRWEEIPITNKAEVTISGADSLSSTSTSSMSTAPVASQLSTATSSASSLQQLIQGIVVSNNNKCNAIETGTQVVVRPPEKAKPNSSIHKKKNTHNRKRARFTAAEELAQQSDGFSEYNPAH